MPDGAGANEAAAARCPSSSPRTRRGSSMRTATRTCSCIRGSSATSTTRSTSIRGTTSTSISQAAQGGEPVAGAHREYRGARPLPPRSPSRRSLLAPLAHAQPKWADPAKMLRVDVPHRGDRLRSAGDVGPLLEPRQPRDLRAAVPVTTTSRGRTGSCRTRRRRCPRSPPTAATGRSGSSPGIYFADDPAFKGKKRELTADDYVYAWKRLLDPKVRSPMLWFLDGKIAGSDEVIAKAKETGKLDYDAPIEGLHVARPLHAAAQAHRARLRAAGVPDAGADGGRRARSDRGVRRRLRLGDGQSRRHRPVQA